MTTRRSNVKGRGSEILFGAPQAVKIKPLPSRQSRVADKPTNSQPDGQEVGRNRRGVRAFAPSPAPAAEPAQKQPTAAASSKPSAASSGDADLLDGLVQEARDARATTEVAVNQALPKVPAAPASLATTLDVEEPPASVVEASVLPGESTVEGDAQDPALPDSDDGRGAPALPPGLPPGFFKVTGVAAADIQSTGEPQKPLELPERILTPEEKQEILDRLGAARLQELDKEITMTYEQVLATVGENADLTTECYNQLLKGREILLLQDAARIPQVEYYIEQVRARLKRASQSNAGAKKFAWLIAGWGLLWFMAFAGVLIGLNYSAVQNVLGPATAANTPVDMSVFLPAMVWGGIGGVAAVFYSLFKHVGRRDFDTQFNLSYVGKPFLGVILGATVYVIVHLMVMTLGILPVGGETAQTPILTPWIIYLLAWACGFKENRIFDLVDRVMKRIFSGEQEEAPEPAT
jgi:hypothetical protein